MNKEQIKSFAHDIRLSVINGAHNAGRQGVHIGGALSCVDILAVLYGAVMNIDPMNPCDVNRDRLILSKGHDCLALYAVLKEKGFITAEELKENYLQDGGFLPTHPVKNLEKGIEFSGGSLGLGLGFGIGEALAARINNKSYKTFVIMGDGECDEGSCWEAFIAASHYKLNNLILYVDKNGFQSDGAIADIMPIDITSALKALGWNVYEVDGHDTDVLYDVTIEALGNENTPSAIIANTVKGKGVSFMEGNNAWHHGHLTEEQFEQSINELELYGN